MPRLLRPPPKRNPSPHSSHPGTGSPFRVAPDVRCLLSRARGLTARANQVCAGLYVDSHDFEACKAQTLDQGLGEMRQAIAAKDDHVRLARTTQMMTAAIKP